MNRPCHVRAIMVLAATLWLGGCYAWREVQPAAAVAGRQVRVTVEPAEAARQQPALGRLTQTLEGVVVEGSTADILGLTVAQRTAATAGPAFNVFLEVPWRAVQRVETRELSASRTALLAGAGAAIVVTALALDAGGTGGGSEDPGTNSRVRIPLFRLLFH